MSTSEGATEIIGKLRRRLGDEDVLYHVEGARRFGHAFTIVHFVDADGTVGDPKFSIDTRTSRHKLDPFA